LKRGRGKGIDELIELIECISGPVATMTVGVKGLNHSLEQSNAGVSTGKKTLS
jgi:hypothetical protein